MSTVFQSNRVKLLPFIHFIAVCSGYKLATKLHRGQGKKKYGIYLWQLYDLPAPLRNRVFSKLFTQAKIANMTKEEIDEYQQSLTNYRAMYLKEYEYKKNLAIKDRKIAEKNRIIAQNCAKIAGKDARIAELERRFELN